MVNRRACPNCNHPNAPAARFCGSCGISLAAVTPDVLPKRRRGWLIGGVIFLLGVVSMVIIVIQFWPERPGTELASTLPLEPTAVSATFSPVPVTETPTPSKTAVTSVPSKTPTFTPSPTQTPEFLALTPTVTPTRKPVMSYLPIPLGSAANAALDFVSPPTGNVDLNGIPFQLSERAFKSQASVTPHNSYPTSILLSMDVPRTYQVYLLLNTGNGFTQFNGMVIGQIVVHCNGTPAFITELELGSNIREWHTANNVVSTAARTRQVWSGTTNSGTTGRIDLLTLDLPAVCRNGRLTGIELLDTSVSNVNSLDPALNLIGVTVEYDQIDRTSTGMPVSVNVEFTVEATQAQNETGLYINQGQTVVIEYVGGSCRAGPLPTWPLVGPRGDEQVPAKATFPVSNAPVMSLIGGVGTGPPFPIGKRIEFESANSGQLWLAANDDGFADNAGALTVRITIIN